MPKPVKDKLTPQGKKFFEEIKKLCAMEVQIGFTVDKSGFDESHSPVDASDYDEGPTVAEVAAWNEFGTRSSDGSERIPSRPFMRQSIDNNSSVISAMSETQLKLIAEGKTTADEAMRAIGALQVGLIQHEIRDGGFVENSKETKKRKGGSETAQTTPLIDTGRLRQSAHYNVKSREG